VSFRGGRLAVTPIELDAATARRLREQLPGANYESGRSQLSLRVPDDPALHFSAVIHAADVLLAVQAAA
jgi:transcription-repair coupling factor (superfamily II helicase)